LPLAPHSLRRAGSEITAVPAASRARCGKTGYQSGIPVLVLVWLACWSGRLDSQLQGAIKLGAQNRQGTRIAIRFPLQAVSA